MGIRTGNIKLAASQVMDDVPEGGGAPTGTKIADGVSNAIFPDISELDRAGGRVNLRKVFVTVDTDDTDSYFGCNVIVAEPPRDPRVSVTLFTTRDTFDRRLAARRAIESYLAVGSAYAGYLFGNHLDGQSTVTLLQREKTELPVVGSTLVLRRFEGQPTEAEQYIRITHVDSQLRTFADDDGEFTRVEVVLGLSDQLRGKFPGFDAMKKDAAINYTGKTKVYDTIVADAARYYGVVPLAKAAGVGDVSIYASGIFTQLVPSAQVETPIADARLNQQSALTVPGSSGMLSRQAYFTLRPDVNLYVGGALLPGSVKLVVDGKTLVDDGGVLINQADGSQVGLVDYGNGVLTANTLVTNGGNGTISWTPGAVVSLVSESIGLDVTQEGQRLTWVFSLMPVPAKGSITVSYLAGGRWYVLNDNGAGQIKGADTGHGSGSINATTGTVSLTLGALPDVGSKIIVSYAPVQVVPPTVPAVLGPAASGARFMFRYRLQEAVLPNSVRVSCADFWGTGVVADNGTGLLGDSLAHGSAMATGTIAYGWGELLIAFETLLPPGQQISVKYSRAVQHTETGDVMADQGATYQLTLPGGVQPSSLRMMVFVHYNGWDFPGHDTPVQQMAQLQDDGAGRLFWSGGEAGSVNYQTGAVTLNKQFQITTTHSQWVLVQPDPTSPKTYMRLNGTWTRKQACSLQNGPAEGNVISAGNFAGVWGNSSFWLPYQTKAYVAEYAGIVDTARALTLTVDAIELQAVMPRGFTMANGVQFTLGGELHTSDGQGIVQKKVDPATGKGVIVGKVDGAQGVVRLTSWEGSNRPSPVVSGFSAVLTPAIIGEASPMVLESAVFRTAVSPLRNGSFSLVGKFQGFSAYTVFNASTDFIVTADNEGIISSGGSPITDDRMGSVGVFGRVDYETGIVEVWFGCRYTNTTVHAGMVGVHNISHLKIPEVELIAPVRVFADSLRYNASAYTYLPLDADLLGIDPVRLPSDGRVPIFRPGSFAVVGHTKQTQPLALAAGQTINLGRVRLSRVRLLGHDGRVIDGGYTADLEAGTVHVDDATGYPAAVVIQDRIEDMLLVRDAQINGLLTFTRQLTHDYPVGSYISSALIAGDLHARVSVLFDQQTWTGEWSDGPIGASATGTFNDVLAPIRVTNRGAVTERWYAQIAGGGTTFSIVGEHVGVIAVGSMTEDCRPFNPAAGAPYFVLPALGWGGGWPAGAVLRFNTVGVPYSAWLARTVQQGPESVDEDSFSILIRGDVDRP